MSTTDCAKKPTWTYVAGAVSSLLGLEFWLHLLVPYLRWHVPFPFWPQGALIDLILALILGCAAAIKGSRFWWAACLVSLLGLSFLLFAFSG
jgi:hypothetical protein